MEENNRYPNFVQALGLMGMVVLGASLTVILLRILQIPDNTIFYVIVKRSAGVFIICFPIKYAMDKHNLPVKQAICNLQNVKSYVFPAIILIMGVMLIMIPFELYLKYIFYSVASFYIENSILDLVDIPYTTILTPILEEILFREIIFNGFLKRYSTIKSVLLSSILFGIMHVSLVASFTATITAIFFSYLYLKTKSIWICIIAHIITNIMAIGYINYLLINYLYFNVWTYLIAGTIFITIGFYMLNRIHTVKEIK